MLSIFACENLHIEQLDLKTIFIHGDLVKEIYMHQPEGFLEEGNNKLVCQPEGFSEEPIWPKTSSKTMVYVV